VPTAAELIQEARLEDASFTKTRHTDAVCRAFLAQYRREFLGKLAQVAPELLSTPYTVELPLADFEAGHELVMEVPDPGDPEETVEVPLDYIKILNTGQVNLRSGRGDIPLRMIGHGSRWSPSPEATAWIRAGRLFLGGHRAVDWSGVQSVTFFYVPGPVSPLTNDTEIEPGEVARRAYVAHLAFRMAMRGGHGELSRSPQEFRDYWLATEREVIHDLVGLHAVRDTVREVF
jgi:hypothetical protein